MYHNSGSVLMGLAVVGLLSSCAPPGQIKKHTTPGHIQQHTGHNPASGNDHPNKANDHKQQRESSYAK